jgi:hypothetical protein
MIAQKLGATINQDSLEGAFCAKLIILVIELQELDNHALYVSVFSNGTSALHALY